MDAVRSLTRELEAVATLLLGILLVAVGVTTYLALRLGFQIQPIISAAVTLGVIPLVAILGARGVSKSD